MKNNVFLFTLLLLFGTRVYAQPKVSASKPYQVIDSYWKDYYSRGDEAMAIKFADEKMIIQKFNTKKPELLATNSFNYTPDENGIQIKKARIIYITEFNDRYYYFYTSANKDKEDSEKMYMREIDFAKGEPIGNGTFLYEANNVAGFNTASMMGIPMGTSFGNYLFQKSYSGSHLLIQYSLKPKIKRDALNNEIVGLNIFDKDLKPVWNQEITMPYTEKKMNIMDYTVDAGGNAYILSLIYNDNSTKIKKGDDPNFHIELLKYKPNSTTAEIIPLEMPGKFIGKLWIYGLPESKIVCVGYYNSGKNLSNADGIISFTIDNSGKVIDTKSFEIPMEILNQNESKREQKRNEKAETKSNAEFANLRLNELIVRDDGSYVLVGEQAYSVTTESNFNGRITRTTRYYYNDILVSKLSNDGKLTWMKKIPKLQMGYSGLGGLSYKILMGQETHYVVFADNRENNKLLPNQVPEQFADGKNGYLTACSIDDSTGASKRIPILDMEEFNDIQLYQFSKNRILKAGDNAFVFECYKKKKEDIMIRVDFNKK